MNNTPRTDAELFLSRGMGIVPTLPKQSVPANLARTLERELAAVTEQRDEWKAKYIQQNKDLGCEMMDPNGTIWDYAKKLQTELAAVTEDYKKIEDKLRADLRGHPDSELWGESGLIAATMRCVDAVDTLTEQRDRLAEALESVKCELGVPQPEYPSPVANAYWIADEALQSLNPDHTGDANDMIATVKGGSDE